MTDACYSCKGPRKNGSSRFQILDGKCDKCRGFSADQHMRLEQTKPYMAEFVKKGHDLHHGAKPDVLCIFCHPLTDEARALAARIEAKA